MSKNTKKLVPELRFPDFLGREGWKEKTLKDAITPVAREVSKPSTNYLALGIRSHGKGTFQKPDQAPEKNAMDKLYLVNREDLIVNITFAWEGAIAIANDADHGCYVSHRFPTYIFKSDVTSPNFFRYVVNRKSFFYKLGLISPGGAGRNRVMSKKDFLELAVDLPDLKEQQKIADCLSSIDDLITAQSQKVEALKTHKKGLMQQLFPREGETVPRLRFSEFRDAGEWKSYQLGQCLSRHPEYGINAAAVPYSENLPTYLRITDISGEGQIRPDQKVSVAKEVTDENYLEDGDIVLARTGASVGKSYKYRSEDGRLVFAGFLIRIRPNEKKLNSELLFQFLSTEQYWRWV